MKWQVICIFVFALLTSGCHHAMTASAKRSEEDRRAHIDAQTKQLQTADGQTFINGVNALGFHMLSYLAAQYDPDNICVSPASAHLALDMLENGAAGATKDAIDKTLGIGSMSSLDLDSNADALTTVLGYADPKVDVENANSVWTDPQISIRPQYLDATQRYYDATSQQVDLGSADGVKRVNEWVSDKTKGNIKTLFDGPQPGTILLLLDAIYFKGNWSTPFDASATADGTFHLLDGTDKQTPMMHRSDHFDFGQVDNVKVLSVPYGSGRLEMVFVLPDDAGDLQNVVSSLDTDDWDKWMKALSGDLVRVTLPKFKMEDTHKLNDVLKAIGMAPAFDSGAEFSALSSSSGIVISQVLQKTTMQCDEQGVVATAVTAVSGMVTSAGPNSTPPHYDEFTADHPFLYAIRDTSTGAILFAGVVAKP